MKSKKVISLFLLMTTYLVSCNAQNKNLSPNTKPKHTENRIFLSSKSLGENREVLIYLPSHYNEHLQNYPVIFVMDAEQYSLFDLTKSIVSFLTKLDLMPPSIVVGVTNNGNRDNRYQMTSGKERGSGFYQNRAGDYTHFFKENLIPYIDQNYRTVSHRTIIGLSPSNGPLYEAFYNHPELFNAYVFLATDFYFRYSKEQSRGNKLMEAMLDKSHPKASVYFGIGEEDIVLKINSNNLKQFKEYENKLKQSNIQNIDYKFDLIAGDRHYEMAMKGIKNAIMHIYPDEIWQRKDQYFSGWDNIEEGIHTHFNALSKHYGFEIHPLESKIIAETRALIRWKKNKDLEKANTLLKAGMQYYPNSASLCILRAQVLQIQGNSRANIFLQRSKELALKFPPLEYNWFNELTHNLDQKQIEE